MVDTCTEDPRTDARSASATSTSSFRRGYSIALVSTAIWSTTAVLIGYLTTRFHMPPLVLAFWRDLFAASAVFASLAILARPLLRLGRRNVLFFVLYGLVLAVFNALWTFSVTLNGAAVATVLIHSSPALTALVGWRLWDEPLDALKIGAILISIVGCAFVSGAYDPSAWRVNPLGIGIGLATGVGFAAYSLLGRAASRRGVNPWTSTLYSFAFGAVFLSLLQRPDTLFWLSNPPASGATGWQGAALGWATLIVLAVGPTIFGYGLYTVSLRFLPTATANVILTLEPALTALWAFMLLGERLTPAQLLGGGLNMVGVLVLRVGERAGRATGASQQASEPQSL